MYLQSEEKLIVCGLVAHVCVPCTQPQVPSTLANTGEGGGEAARPEGAQLKAAPARHIASKDVAVAYMSPGKRGVGISLSCAGEILPSNEQFRSTVVVDSQR